MRYKIQTRGVFGWGDLRENVEGTDKYVDSFYETKKLADEECLELNTCLEGEFRVVPITTRSDEDFY